MNEFDVVRILTDIPHLNLKKGAMGTIILVYDTPGLPRAYEVEFVYDKGRTLAQSAIDEKNLELC